MLCVVHYMCVVFATECTNFTNYVVVLWMKIAFYSKLLCVLLLILQKLHRYWFVLVEDKHQVALVYFKNEDSYIARQRNEGFLKVDYSQSINVTGEYLSQAN